jgi:CubicO group peptidase (beta-lactamase class C family)
MDFGVQKQAQLGEFVTQFMQEHQVPGLTVALAQGDDVVYAKAFGYRSLEKRIPATTDTIFGIASITKTFAAISIAQLVEEGKMSFDDPVQKILPGFCMPGGGGQSVTIHHLLSHTSGMPPLPFLSQSFKAHSVAEEDAPSAPRSYSELIEAIASYTGQVYCEPGLCLNYSNECYALLGAVIKRVSGLTFAEYVRERIIRPLGLKRTMISFEEMFEHEEVTELYTKEADGTLKGSTRWPTAPGFQAAGRLKSCCTDLIRVFQMYANGGTYRGTQILSEDSVRDNMTRRFQYALRDSYAHALIVLPAYHGVTLVSHGGAGKGISAVAGFVPERGLSAVVLCNLSAVPVARVWLAAMNLALGLPIETPRQEYDPTDWAPEEMERLAGHYKSAEGSELTLLVVNDQLELHQGSKRSIVKRLNETTGLVESNRQQQEVKFYLGPDGHPWGVGQDVRIIPIVREPIENENHVK